MFDYLLHLDDVEVDNVDNNGRTPLLYTVSERFHEYVALELIKKGANIHLKDCNGFTLLHMAAKRPFDDNLRLGQLLIEKGLDVNAQAEDGSTPLYQACANGNIGWIHMLLFYGACATIPSDRGILPIAVLSPNISLEQQNHIEDVLFDHTFDGDKVEVKLATLVASMRLECSIFCRIVNVASTVDYDIYDLQYLNDNLSHLEPKHLRQFAVKFGNIMKELIINFEPLVTLTKTPTIKRSKDVFGIFLENSYISYHIQVANPKYLVSDLVRKTHHGRLTFTEEEVTKIVYTMLTYGLNITSTDLETVFECYGYCSFFKMLLHMEIEIGAINYNSIAVFYYKPSITIEDEFIEWTAFPRLLSYYNHPKLKKHPRNTNKAKLLPLVPSLVELSRNVARKYIVSRYNIKNSMQFYTILNWLPVGKMTKNIIALETELY